MRKSCLRRLGSIIQTNSARIFLVATITLVVLCVAIKSAKLDSELNAWIQRTHRVDSELNYVRSSIGDGSGSTSELVLQTPRNSRANVLTVDSFMIHLEAMAIATHVTTELDDVSWSLKDICYAPTLPVYEIPHMTNMLEGLVPCVIKTPLDCFWEGSQLLGPEQPITLGSIGPQFTWANSNPLLMVETLQRTHPNSYYPYNSLIDFMRRVGITSGYQNKPCLDPIDPKCPVTAPNKFSKQPPNIGAQLSDGCRGFAANQMHWKPEEIVGGIVRNKSRYIIHASALQSTIQLMGEQDLYEYYSKHEKTERVNNWSAEKAKLVIDSWQQRFKEELNHFSKTSDTSKPYKMYAITSKSMLEPIGINSLLDLTNFQLCFFIMTIFFCVAFPSFNNVDQLSAHQVNHSTKQVSIGHLKTIPLAIVISLFVGLIFIASLGLSSFMNLPFNMATTQILPPLALYYGFNQFNMIANLYSQKFLHVAWDDLTTSCLIELFPIITIESISFVIALLATTLIPVSATRVFAFQAIIYILLETFIVIILMPSIMILFLWHHLPNFDESIESGDIVVQTRASSRSPCRLAIRTKRGSRRHQSEDSNIEEQIFSRIQDDLRNIRADSCLPSDINFSAHLGSGGLRTSFKMTTSHDPSIPNGSSTQVGNTLVPSKPQNLNFKMSGIADQPFKTNLIPDLVANSLPLPVNSVEADDKLPSITEDKPTKEKLCEDLPQARERSSVESWLFRIYANSLTTNKFVQSIILFLKVLILFALLSYTPKIKYGLQLTDIVAQGSPEYEPFYVREKFFPIYNVFIVTKGNFDYHTNQRLLHEFYKAFEQVDGIMKDEDLGKTKFWLASFRNWLIEIQQKFDADRNISVIDTEDWNANASEAAKLAYKLLSQTGRSDNPIDKSQVKTARLVDSDGIINPKAFYYYLTAWFMRDAFTYTTSEANFKPEPKNWKDDPENLKIEKAKPLSYAQIPFLLKLSNDQQSLKTIFEIRRISQAFEQLNLPNFPTGIPFLFWDQFINLDFVFLVALAIGVGTIFIVIGLMASDFIMAAIIMIPNLLTVLELYGFMGLISIPFNNILAVLLISTVGIATVQTVHFTTCFETKDGNLATRTTRALRLRLRIVITSLLLFFICVYVFRHSKIEFMIKYSSLIFCLAVVNALNSLLVTPIVLSSFGPRYKLSSPCLNNRRTVKSSRKVYPQLGKRKQVVHKKRTYPRVQSEISLSTISEEPQSEAHMHDLKFDLSIKCY